MAYRNYPLTTPEGEIIPVDVLEPIELLAPIAISTSPMGAVVAIPSAAIRFLEIWSTVDCRIGFTAAPVNGISVPGTYYLRADDPRLLIPADAYISGLALAGSGTIYVNILNRWESVKKDYQTDIGE